MARQSCNFGHARIPPDNNLVEGIAVSADNLITVLRPRKVADLTTRVNAI